MADTQDTDTRQTAVLPDDTALRVAREEGRRADGARQDTMRKSAKKVRLGDEDIRTMLADPDVTIEAAHAQMLNLVGKRDAAADTNVGHVAVTRGEALTRRQAMIDGLAYRSLAAGTPSDLARLFVNYKLRDVADECLEHQGVRTRGVADNELFDAALFGTRAVGLSTSDF